MYMNNLFTSTLVSVALAAVAPLAAAQAMGPAADAPQGQYAQRDDQGKRAFRLPSERVEARLAYLKTALKITGAQQAQWEAFAEVQRRHARAADERLKAKREGRAQRPQGERPNAVERLERRQQMLAVQSQRLGELIAAAKPLYAALSPEQKQIADELLAPRPGHGGFRHRGPHRSA
jgi:hypothetical protein